jgi:hypothetical protein
VTGRVRLMWFLVHVAAIVLGIWAGVRFFDWAS